MLPVSKTVNDQNKVGNVQQRFLIIHETKLQTGELSLGNDRLSQQCSWP